ncbi:Uncharacterized protein PECH_007979 [Penicillium ucsense]|uniref:PAC domain-containing protein n=1 Tax=Penicillium ucsense TaxID=2839758 RepID=A0A8J8W3I3_9EURO|nr:Uncharacterized protein PECM_006427 [Penicillium ucsense]KAF7734461.1 Uncharacterized protein PECH_007979 [Penicillium ucsense]
MEASEILNVRPHKAGSVRSYSPTIVLDDAALEAEMYRKGMGQELDDEPNDIHQTVEEHIRQLNLGLDDRPSSALSARLSNKGLRQDSELPLLQATNPYDGTDQLLPVPEEDEAEGSYDLVAPYDEDPAPRHTLERQADLMFSREHMLAILNSPRYLAQFREFLISERPKSLQILIYYLNACKALKALHYANALVRLSVDVPTAGIDTAKEPVGLTTNPALEARVERALDALTAEELPAFITSNCINVTGKVVEERIRGTLPDKFQGTADQLAEVFCLTDPSRPDNPIIFASAEFHRATQYGMDYVLGRNCRFLQGPNTNPNSVRRIRESVAAGRHHSELFLNYRRDGSPFMNLLQTAPLCDSKGNVRYFIGAQIDVSGLTMEGAQMESFQSLQGENDAPENDHASLRSSKTPSTNQAPSTNRASSTHKAPATKKTEFQELGELFSPRELQTVHDHGGKLFHPSVDHLNGGNGRLWLQSPGDESEMRFPGSGNSPGSNPSGSLTGVYKNYLLVRPYPSLRILFTSPSLQIPGMLQSSFLARIGDSNEKRESILHAMMTGRSVTARIKWVTRFSDQGRYRWIHCTPLLANNREVGVWMVVVIDDRDEELL